MTSFWKSFFASLLAVLVGSGLFLLLSLVVLTGMLVMMGGSGGRRVSSVKPHSVLRIDLSQPLVERATGNALDLFDYDELGFREQITLYDAVALVERAATDPRIEGIYLQVPMAVPMGISALYELREALAEFREQSGKFVVSYADVYSQGGYYLASVGDQVWLNPQGGVAWQGMASNTVFYKGLLDKLGVRAELVRHGRFKGAGEPFVRESLSDENREQIESMVGSVWDFVVDEVARCREVEADSLLRYAERLSVATPWDAVRLGLVDSLYYRDRVVEELASLCGGTPAEEGEPRLVDLGEYRSATTGRDKRQKNLSGGDRGEVAVVYADGDIVDTGDSREEIVGNALAATLREVRKDDDVQAVVLRVNSPGGSALAAEIVWREVWLTQQTKPVIVSMGGYAASGGYYIACGADYVVATPTTLTGSIGVFGLTFDVGEGAREHLGLTTDVVRTGPSADMGNLFRPMTAAERLYMQNGVDSVYARFLEVVAQGRSLEPDSVDRLAGGRVWTGRQAVENGLADGLGTLQGAVRIAAEAAGLESDTYTVRRYPEPEQPSFFSVMGSLSAEAAARVLGPGPGVRGDGLEALGNEARNVRRRIMNRGIRAEMPCRVEIEH